MTWTLEHLGTTKSFADWGFTNLRRTLLSQNTDFVTFEEPVEHFHEATQLQPDATVKIFRDGVKWFEGVVTQTPLTALPEAESHGYVISGPWYHFENNVYKQPWLAVGGTVNIGHIFLNLTVGQALFPINLQMENICDWLLSIFPVGAKPFQKGTIEPVAYPPISEVQAITCAAAMRSQLRWCPDAVLWFDYSESPPKLHVKKRSSLAAVSCAIPDADESKCEIVPRYDLIRPSVSIHYEITSTVNGVNRVGVSFDTAPLGASGDEPGALNLAMNLQGPVRNVSFASLLCDGIDTSSLDWWKEKIPTLKDTRYASIVVSGVTRKLEDGTPSQALPRELIEGQITEWMPFDWEQEVITAKIAYQFRDSAGTILDKKFEEVVTLNVVSTNATTGDFQNATISDTGDPLPVGMAAFLYAALSVLHYDGRFSLVEEEVTGQVGIGNVVNLAGGQAAWTSMNALVQAIIEDVVTGTTEVIVGPPNHISHVELMELLRVGRRIRWTPIATQETGELGDSGLVKLGKPTANRNTAIGQALTEFKQLQDSTTATNLIKFDAANKVVTIEQSNGRNVQIDLTHIPAGVPQAAMPVKLREIEGCVTIDGVPTKMRAVGLFSDWYPIPP